MEEALATQAAVEGGKAPGQRAGVGKVFETHSRVNHCNLGAPHPKAKAFRREEQQSRRGPAHQ